MVVTMWTVEKIVAYARNAQAAMTSPHRSRNLDGRQPIVIERRCRHSGPPTIPWITCADPLFLMVSMPTKFLSECRGHNL
jgi:hypothetical protein